ncbi:MAG TPA: CHRD domain-containing protein [Caulobacteraceae bacterium]|nr:CHRD domain-containing protein [Caulobacteraceae bacterium]
MSRVSLIAIAAVVAMAGSAAQAGILHYAATLKGANEKPPTASGGRGELEGVLDTDRRLLEYDVTFTGLSGPALGAGFHGKDAAMNAAVTFQPTQKPNSIHAQVSLTDAQINDLNAGRWTFDITTKDNPGGEIGGTVERSSGSY